MTDNEIIQVLQYISENGSGACDKCPIFPCGKIKDYEDNQCSRFVAENAIDLINRQKAEIERLKAENEGYKHLDVILHTAIDKITAHIKSEVVKEFAERLKKVWFDIGYESPDVDFDDFVDNLVKEMVGEN